MPIRGEIQRGENIGLQKGSYFVWHSCSDCGYTRWVPKHRLTSYCVKCKGKGSRCYAWIGGRVYDGKGYIRTTVNIDAFFYPMKTKAGYILEHRLVMAKHLKRCLQTWEHVHHKNGIRDDNRIENLELTNGSDHLQSQFKGYRDGYQKGYYDGSNKRITELKQEIKSLQLQIPGRN